MQRKIGIYGTLVYVLLIWTIFQEFILGIMYHFIHVQSLIKLLFFSKDILFVLLYIIALFRTRLPQGFFIFQVLYLPFVIIGVITSLLTSRVSALTALSSARGLILLPAFVTIGYSIKSNEEFVLIIKNKYMRFLVMVAAVGIVEYVLDASIGTKSLWTEFVQLGPYMIDIKSAGNVVSSNGLPGNFYTYAANGAYIQKRLVSFWAHPLTSGYVLILPFMFYFTRVTLKKEKRLKRKDGRCFVIVTIALLLTFTRGTILPALAIVIICLLYRYRTDGGKFLLYISVLLFLGFIGLVVYRDKIFGYIYNGSTSAHLISLESAIKEIGLLGRGTGTFAAATSEGIWTESTFISVAGQLGIIAMIVFIALFLYPIVKVSKKTRETEDFCVSVVLSGFVFFFSGIISEQLCAYTAIAPYYILIGAALRKTTKSNRIISQLQLIKEGVR